MGSAQLPDGRRLVGTYDFDRDLWSLEIAEPVPARVVARRLNAAARQLLTIDGVSPRWLLDALDAVAAVRTADGVRFRCRCCGSLTLTARDVYEICPVCRWEDDPTTIFSPGESRGGPGPNHLSLSEGRANFRSIGVFRPGRRRRGAARDPGLSEKPTHVDHPGGGA